MTRSSHHIFFSWRGTPPSYQNTVAHRGTRPFFVLYTRELEGENGKYGRLVVYRRRRAGGRWRQRRGDGETRERRRAGGRTGESPALSGLPLARVMPSSRRPALLHALKGSWVVSSCARGRERRRGRRDVATRRRGQVLWRQDDTSRCNVISALLRAWEVRSAAPFPPLRLPYPCRILSSRRPSQASLLRIT